MLQSIRDGSRSVGAKIIIGVMVAAMALFGVESLFSLFGTDPDEVAQVNGESIMRQQVELNVQRGLRSGQVPPEQEREFRADTLDQLITSALIDQYAAEGGMYVSDAQLDRLIVARPEFQDQEGQFSQELYRNRLTNAGYTPLAFRDLLRMDTLRAQLEQGLAGSEVTLESERARLSALERQERLIRYAVLDKSDLTSPVEVSEDEIEAFYQENPDRYQRPEQVKLEYVLIDRGAMAENVEVNAEALREAWRERSSDADRAVSHIMILKGDDSEAARERAQQAMDALASGRDFSDVASRYSDDTSSADEGGDLGVISRGFLGDAFDAAAFSLDEGDVSQVVEQDNALHIIKVTDIQRPSFEEQRDALRQQVAMDKVEDKFNQDVQQLIDESFSADDLVSVAEDIGLTLERTDWVSRDVDSGLLSEPGVMEQAFSDEVLEDGYNSDVIELDDDRRLVLRVAEHREARRLPLDQVREQARSSAAAKLRQQVLMERASDLLETPDAIAWQTEQRVARGQPGQLPAAVVETVFGLPAPQDGNSVYHRMTLEKGVALIALDEVNDAEPDPDLESFVARMTQRVRASAVIQGLVETLREQADIEIR